MFRHSTPHQCSLVHIYTRSCITLIHVNLLLPSARGTRQHNQHMRTCVERHRARVLKRPQGKWALHYSYRHLLRSTRVLNNTEVKGHYSTIYIYIYIYCDYIKRISAVKSTFTMPKSFVSFETLKSLTCFLNKRKQLFSAWVLGLQGICTTDKNIT